MDHERAMPQLPSLSRKIVLILILASLIPLAIISLGAWVVFSDLMYDKSVDQLQTVVSDHAVTVDLFLAERMKALELVTLSYDTARIGEQAQLQQVFEQLNRVYPQSFADLGVIDHWGEHLAYIGPHSLLGKNYRDTDWFGQVDELGHYISDVFLGYRGEPHFVIAVRRESDEGKFWILRASVNSQSFERLVSAGRLGNTGDCFIVDRQGRLVTRTAGGGFQYDESEVEIPEAFEGLWVDHLTDKQNRELIRIMKWIKDGQWLLVVQQRESEIMAPVRKAMLRGTWVFLTGVIVIVLAAFFTTRFLIGMIERGAREKHKLNLQFLQASKLASIGEMATGLAHEINNPLAIILSEQTNIDDLLNEIDTGNPGFREISESIRLTMKQVMRCKVITQKMLQFGRQGEQDGKLLCPTTQLNEIIRLIAQQARVNNVEICIEHEPDTPRIHFDSGEFQQIVTNLTNNAISAIGSDGGGILISCYRDNDRFHMVFEDTGSGIAAENIRRLFTPFYTTKAVGMGTGLGLSVCYGIVTRWRGEIWAESGPGQGAVFHVVIPAA
jgi:two-component system, NtrC family, sensor kinase